MYSSKKFVIHTPIVKDLHATYIFYQLTVSGAHGAVSAIVLQNVVVVQEEEHVLVTVLYLRMVEAHVQAAILKTYHATHISVQV